MAAKTYKVETSGREEGQKNYNAAKAKHFIKKHALS